MVQSQKIVLCDNHFKYWKLNVSLLTDPVLQKEMQTDLADYSTLNYDESVSPSIL